MTVAGSINQASQAVTAASMHQASKCQKLQTI